MGGEGVGDEGEGVGMEACEICRGGMCVWVSACVHVNVSNVCECASVSGYECVCTTTIFF